MQVVVIVKKNLYILPNKEIFYTAIITNQKHLKNLNTKCKTILHNEKTRTFQLQHTYVSSSDYTREFP